MNNRKPFARLLREKQLPVGQTPKTAIWKKNKATVWFYPAKEKRYQTPLFLIYSLVSKPYILDLSPESSMIQAFTNSGYDVYLLDFGIAGYEDKDMTLSDYIRKYIQQGVRKAISHAQSNDITVVGYCLGGMLAAMYAAIADEQIKNLILFVTPIDFRELPLPDNWREMLRSEQATIERLIDEYGIVPASAIDKGIKLVTSPVSITPYLSLFQNGNDEKYAAKWQRFHQWARDHVPFPGQVLKQLMFDIALENKLAKNQLLLDGECVSLRNITANLLVVSAKDDALVPEQLSAPMVDLVSSPDKTYKLVNGGHATLAIKGHLPAFLQEWLSVRSD